MFKKDQLNQLALPLILSNVVSLIISLCDTYYDKSIKLFLANCI